MITKKRKREELQYLRDEALQAYLNREDFQYDVNADALYRHYKDRYTELGKKAMTDTMGQAAALTGGYGSTYAQNVGQQAYDSYLDQLGDVVPALYKLAYDRYRDEGDKLYKTYQSWAQLEQQAAQQEQWEREYELAERERQDAYNQFLREQERQNSQTQTATYQPDYWAMLSYHQKLGQHSSSDTSAVEPQYDNGNVSEGNIKTMQRLLGLPDTGKWTALEQQKAGNLNADDAWQDYQRGKLQSRSRSGMSMDEWAKLGKKQSKSSGVSNANGNTSAVQNFISGMVTEDQAAERGDNPTEWRMMVVDRLNRVNMTMEEFEQLEKYYGLDIPGGSSAMIQDNTANIAAQKMSYAEYREKTAAQKVSDLNTAVQMYFNDYQLFVNSAVNDIQNVGYQNATSMLEDRVGTAKELRKQAEILASALRMNTDIISDDYSELLTQIVSTKTGVDSIMDFFDGQAKYYSRWDSEDAFNKATERAKQYYDNWGHYVNADDFDYYSAKGAAIQNPSVTEAEGYFNFFGWRPGSEEVGNIVTYSRDNYANIAAMSEGGKYDVVGDLRYKDMTDDEVAIYNYLLAKEGKERAGEFLSYIEEDLNARIGKRTADLITSIDIPVVEELATGLYGLGAGIDQWISGTRQLFTNKQLPISITQYANSEIANSLDGFGKHAYTGANVIGNMAPSILLSYVTAGAGAPAAVAQGVGAAAVGMSAAGNAYGSALRDGDSVGQARAYSTLVGAAEATLQYILGGIGSLGGVTDDLIKAKINMIDNSLLRISAKLGVDVLSEISEEELQNFLEPAFRSIIFGEEYDAPTIDEMIETAIVTAGTTLLLGGGDTVSSDLSENRQFVESGQKIMGTDGGMDALMNLANEVAGVSSAQMQSTLTNQIDKVNQKPTARNVGQLYATVQAANNQANAPVNQEDIAKRLLEKGFYSQEAAGVAEAVAARLNGQELTRTQRSILSSSLNGPAVQDVISDIMKKKPDGIDSTLKNAYDEINTIGGNKNGRETTLWNLSNQRADGSLSGSRGGTRATNEDRSGVPGTLGENDGIFEKTLPTAQQRGLTSEADTFGDNDYATVTEGSALHQVQNAFREKYGIECRVIKDSSWTRSSPAYSKDGVVYIRESIDPDTLSTAVPHEATHVMKQQNFQPYIDFITNTPDWLNFRSETVRKFLKMIADHIKIDPFTANNQQLFRYYDELNSTVYGLYKSGVLDSNEFDFHEYIPGAFNDFASYIQEMDRLHEEFRNQRNVSAEAMEADGGVDALLNLANEVAGVSSADMRNTLMSQIDKVSQKPTARNVGQLYATVQAANNQTKASVGQSNATPQTANDQVNTAINQADVATSLISKGISSKKADGIAEAIVARLNGQELTRPQRNLLSSALNSSAVRDVMFDLINNKKSTMGQDSQNLRVFATDVVDRKTVGAVSDGIDSTRNKVYDKERMIGGVENVEEAALRNLSTQRADGSLPSNGDHATVIEGSALPQLQNAFLDGIYEGGASVSRPTWRQSELDAVTDFPDYNAQKSFINGEEVPYGTKGSVRPDYYKDGFSVDIKNYNVENESGRSNLARNIEAQYYQRTENLPDGTKQSVLIDIRGQNVSISALIVLYNDIMQRTNNGVEILFKMN